MITAILKLIFLFLFICVVVVAFVAYRIVKSFLYVKKTFSGKSNKDFYGNQADNHDVVVIDKRSPETANKKIFDKNEGEYVDFEED